MAKDSPGSLNTNRMHEQSTISPQAAVIPGAGKEPSRAYEPAQEININDFFLRMPLQRKLAVGATDDPLEQEADEMANRVMRMPEMPFIQKKCAHCEAEEKAQRKPLASFIQKKGSETGTTASDTVSSSISVTKGGGSSLPATTRSFMESRFGADFSGVHIHTGDYAVQLSRDLNAHAFTTGNDIYFNSGNFSPESSSGKQLLAHELTHVVQQNGGGGVVQRSEVDDRSCAGLTDIETDVNTKIRAEITAARTAVGGPL